MDVASFLQDTRKSPNYAGQIVHEHTVPARNPCFEDIPTEVNRFGREFVAALGIGELFGHQSEAIRSALRGQNVCISTSAASGKSLCWQVPLYQELCGNDSATALLLFPSKALARDQIHVWNQAVEKCVFPEEITPPRAVAYDADSGSPQARGAGGRNRVLVTNPEILHMRLLASHGRWERFFRGLRYVVLDEAHTYTGFFGANMANVFRRMDRICRFYGSKPQFVCLTATSGNPDDAASRVTGKTFSVIRESGAGSGAKTFVLWNPPKIKSGTWRSRRSANVEATELMTELVRRGNAVICFSKARNTAEMIYRYARDALRDSELARKVIPYRGGYSPAQRRDWERRLREGDILGVSTTRALELGIDIGVLDACIIVGYPGNLNSFFQQAGRVGRSGRNSLVVLVGVDTAINQYVMEHPEFLFSRPLEQTIIEKDNPFVVVGHVRCAAAELPIKSSEKDHFGYSTGLCLDVCEETAILRNIGGNWFHAQADHPAFEVRLRGYGDESTVVLDEDTGAVLDRMDKYKSLRLFYPGAIYFRHGNTYKMISHDTQTNVVGVKKTSVDYYTDPVTGTMVDHVDTVLERRALGCGTVSLGEVYAKLETPLYERVRFYSLERIAKERTHVEPIGYEAVSFWLNPPDEIPREAASLGLNPESGMKGILYCASRILPLFLTSDHNDFDWSLGCRNAPWHTMFWYEFYLHGIGHAEACFERLEEILTLTLDHLRACDCQDGCPSCTGRLIIPYHVRNIELGEGIVASRRAAAAILGAILSGDSVCGSLQQVDAPVKRNSVLFSAPSGRVNRSRPMPLDERTRSLLIRHLERRRNPPLPVDHAVDFDPPEGIPSVESIRKRKKTDQECRSGHSVLKSESQTPVKLRRRLDSIGKKVPAKRNRSSMTSSPAVDEKGTGSASNRKNETDDHPVISHIRIGDPIARKARMRRKKR